MKIYTRTGDDGTTGLVGGGRVAKTDPRIEAIGTVDELNSWIGLCRSAGLSSDLDAVLAEVQARLFDIGAELATPASSRFTNAALTDNDVLRLEKSMDLQNEELPPLHAFVLPGGTEAAARLHGARSVCRKAERSVLAFRERCTIRNVIGEFLNRLSDWLFVAARTANARMNVEDVTWSARKEELKP